MYINYAYIHTDQNTIFVDIVFEWIAATCSLKLIHTPNLVEVVVKGGGYKARVGSFIRNITAGPGKNIDVNWVFEYI